MSTPQQLWNDCVTQANEHYLSDGSFRLNSHPDIHQQAVRAAADGADSFEPVVLGARRLTSWWQLALWNADVEMLSIGLDASPSAMPLDRVVPNSSEGLTLGQAILDAKEFNSKEFEAWTAAVYRAFPDWTRNPKNAALFLANHDMKDKKSVLGATAMLEQGWNISLIIDACSPSVAQKFHALVAEQQHLAMEQEINIQSFPMRHKKI